MEQIVVNDSLKQEAAHQDTIKHDSLQTSLAKDSLTQTIIPNDSISQSAAKKESTQTSKSMLEAPVEYDAKDSIVYVAGKGLVYLYGDSKVDYQNLELTAAEIAISLDSSIVHAIGAPDSTGVMIGEPIFKQGSDQYDAKKISYNFKTRKGFVEQINTTEGDGFLTSESAKRTADGEMHIHHGKYTTCDADHPHFYLALTRAKVRPGKDVVFGPAYLVVEDVPLPLAIPYGFFPVNKSYSSGFIMPSYGDEMSRSFYLRDGGYSFAINDYIDLKLKGEIYTKAHVVSDGNRITTKVTDIQVTSI